MSDVYNGNPVDGRAATTSVERPLGDLVAPLDGERRGHGWDSPPLRPKVLTGNLILFSILLILVGAIVGYVVSGAMSKTYGSRFQVSVPTTATDDALVARQVENQIQVLEGRGLLSRVANRAGVPLDTLVKRVHASVVPGSSVVTVTLTAPDRGAALAAAQDMADQYMHAVATGPDQRSVDYLQSQISKLSDEQASIAQQRAAAPSREAAASLDARSLSVAGQITALQSQLTTLTTQALSSSNVELLTAPYGLTEAVSPKPVQAAAVGALIGGIVAAAVVGSLALLRRPGGQHR
jgi:capsular polysaccharide biosynthesis protein